jgi:hypothetical protein
LIALYFGRVATIALVANVLVVPMAFLIVLAASLSIVVGSMVGLAAEVFNHASLALVHVLLAGLRLLVAIPGGFLEVPRVDGWLVAVWYGTLGAVLLGLHARRPPPVPIVTGDE